MSFYLKYIFVTLSIQNIWYNNNYMSTIKLVNSYYFLYNK